ncbi:conserved hypothetical protein [Pediculus humanus corporis]|uniref:IST1 homolog n=1 Tax=Pediculus humanus subsp. corporis TaxID=121224 RepID=E0VRR1_PEDHC|nr:uncharacterized protein Phum_PHUM401810 [Pediculus humanus corporis]EEB16067.1 conserved hypothetical protein [Pediculus humanus corporis]
MFSSGVNYTKLKTFLRLAINRLKLLEKKKMELAQKSRREIADFIETGKAERAKIRVEHIIREDYMVEAMEMVEMFCDLLLARFGLLQQMKNVDPGLEEAISSILWAGPRLAAMVPELKSICEQLALKYGKDYAESCKEDKKDTISEKLKHRLGVESPTKLLVEKYLIEIAKNFNVEYEPDEKVMREGIATDMLLDLNDDNKNNFGGGVPSPPGFKGFPQPPMAPPSDFQPFNYNYPSQPQPQPQTSKVGGFVVPKPSNVGYGVPFSYNIPPMNDPVPKPQNYSYNFEQPPSDSAANDEPNDLNQENLNKPKPSPRSKMSPPGDSLFPELPNVPNDVPSMSNEDLAKLNQNDNEEIDFDDLTKRFENLKKKN